MSRSMECFNFKYLIINLIHRHVNDQKEAIEKYNDSEYHLIISNPLKKKCFKWVKVPERKVKAILSNRADFDDGEKWYPIFDKIEAICHEDEGEVTISASIISKRHPRYMHIKQVIYDAGAHGQHNAPLSLMIIIRRDI